MEDLTRTEKDNRRKGMILSIIFHTVLIILAALYGFTYQNPPPDPGGIQVNLGVPDVGQGIENAPAGKPAEPVKEPEPKPEKETPPPPKEVTKPEPKKEAPKPEPKKEVIQTEDPEAIALKKQKEEQRKKAEAEARERAEAERKQREEEARKQREEEARRKELEDLVAGGLGGGKGSGKGNTGKPGNQGDPGGDPNSNVLTGISTGSGVVGGGLGNRGVAKRGPSIEDNSQERGTVFLDICVDSDGNVISAEYTQKGSTTASPNLINLAKQNARQWKFQKADVEKQCGTIRYDFRLK